MYTQRMAFLQTLRGDIKKYGSENIVYIDESGFEEQGFNPYAWAPKGLKVYGEKTGNAKKNRTNLIMAQRHKQWLAPFLFTGSCHAGVVEQWLESQLFKELSVPSVIVADNAPFHRKSKLSRLTEKYGHKMLFLSPYSPDFNPIEQSFGLIKRKRYYAPPGTTLDELVMGNY